MKQKKEMHSIMIKAKTFKNNTFTYLFIYVKRPRKEKCLRLVGINR